MERRGRFQIHHGSVIASSSHTSSWYRLVMKTAYEALKTAYEALKTAYEAMTIVHVA